jgi:hypothetical protein
MAFAAPRIVKQVFDRFPLAQLPPLYSGPAVSTAPTIFVLPDHARSRALLALMKLLGLEIASEKTTRHSNTSHPYLCIQGRVLADEQLHDHVQQLAQTTRPTATLKSAHLALFSVLEDALLWADYVDQTTPLAWSDKQASFLQVTTSQINSLAHQTSRETFELLAIRERYTSEEDTWTTILSACQRNLEAIEELAPADLEDLEDKEFAALIVGYIGTICDYNGKGQARLDLKSTVNRYTTLVGHAQRYNSL